MINVNILFMHMRKHLQHSLHVYFWNVVGFGLGNQQAGVLGLFMISKHSQVNI